MSYKVGKKEYEHCYIISSERCWDRNDEMENELYSDRELKVGEFIILDGLRWYVDEVVG